MSGTRVTRNTTTVHHLLEGVTLKPLGDVVSVMAEISKRPASPFRWEYTATVKIVGVADERLVTPQSARELAQRLCEAADLADETHKRLSGRYDDVAEAQS